MIYSILPSGKPIANEEIKDRKNVSSKNKKVVDKAKNL